MSSSSDLKKNAQDFLVKAAVKNPAQLEVVLENEKQRSIGWADRKPSLESASVNEGLCLRVLEKGGQGIVTARGAGIENAPALASKALEVARLSPRDEHRRFAGPAKQYPPDIEIDSSAFQTPTGDIQAHLAELEGKILKSDPRIKKIVKMNYSETQASLALANSLDLSLSSEESHFSFVVEILAEDQGETEVGWDYQIQRFRKDLDVDRVAFSVASHTLQSLGGKPLPSGPYPIVVHPRVGAQLLSLVTDALSAEAVQLGRSFWRNGPGSKVAQANVSLIDDPLLQNGVASAPFDHEGVAHERLAVVEKGVLKDYFYDLRSAARANRSSNGRGVKASLEAIPKPGATNFFMEPGPESPESLLASHKKVFLLHDVMGLHMADPITGEFSLGAAGSLYENGRFVRPVRGVTVAGTIGNVFKNITAVGKDLTWYGSVGSPSFLVEMTVAGT